MATFGPYRGVVARVVDGDTVNVRLDVGFDLTIYARVRVAGVNAPELATPAGKLARQYAETLLPEGAEVLIVSHGWDKYGGRVDGEITLADGRDLGKLMLVAGHAKPYDGTGPKP